MIGPGDPYEPEGDVPVDNPEQARGRRLSDHETVSGTTVHGWPSVAFGSVLAAIGAGASITVLTGDFVGATTLLVPFVCGGIFAAGGLGLVTRGFVGIRQTSRLRRERERRPEEPWRWDYRWDEAGARDDTVERLALWTYRTLFLAALLLPFNWLAFFSGVLSWWSVAGFGLVVAFFDLLLLFALYRFAGSLLHLLRYGVGAVRYARFPFFLGESLEVSFVPAKRMSDLRKLKATLRCVDERFERFDPDDPDSSTTVVPYELYSDARTATGTAAGTAPDAGFSFPLPEDMPAARLGERPPVYWELEIEAEAPGVDYAATFLVPIYSRDSA
jgi:hypothetical protein